MLPIGPSELAQAGPIMVGTTGAETVLWATGDLQETARTFVVPVDAATSRITITGRLPSLPTVPFRVRVQGVDRAGTRYQRMSSRSFRASTILPIVPRDVVLPRGQRTLVKALVRNIGAAVISSTVGPAP